MTDNVVVDGRAAWHRLRDRERQTFSDWLLIGAAEKTPLA